MLFEVGRLCVKLAGRDSNKKCVVVEKVDDNHVLIDGETRRRKCNVRHLEPLDKVLKIADKAPRAAVVKAFSDLGIELKDTKPKKATEKPKKQKAKKTVEKPKKEVKKKAEKKPVEEKKEVEPVKQSADSQSTDASAPKKAEN